MAGERKRPSQRTSERNIRVRPAIALDDHDVAEVVLETELSITSVQRWARGLPVFRSTIRRIERALEKLGIEKKERETKGRRRVVGGSKAA